MSQSHENCSLETPKCSYSKAKYTNNIDKNDNIKRQCENRSVYVRSPSQDEQFVNTSCCGHRELWCFDSFTRIFMMAEKSSGKPFTCWTIRSGHWLLLSAVMLSIYIPTSANAQKLAVTDLSTSRETGICQSVDIRNSLETFQRLRGCRVVEGFVQILLFDKTEEESYSNISFPELTEITDYLLLYRVNGLKTLGQLFPNLSVIRGQKTFFNYALVVFEMSSLQEIGLHSLTDIVHGLVRIDKNPSLCYVNTIDWDLIAKEGKGDEHFIKSNKNEDECPICPGDDGDEDRNKCSIAKHRDPSSNGPKSGRHLCWNRHKCQKVCPDNCTHLGRTCNEKGQCCAELCLGGCGDLKLDDCVVCKKLSIVSGQKRTCIRNCPSENYEFLNRRCISKNECINMKRPVDLEHEYDEKPYKPYNKSCLLQCPPNYYEYVLPNKTLTCKPCEGMCRLECPGASVDSIKSALNLRGCTHIKGSLEIQIRGGRNIVKELEDNLNMIEVIDGYLKIVRSFPLISLSFLKNLREINGKNLESGKYVLIVLDNQNLQELWDWEMHKNHTLKIRNGRLFFHFNPKLCLSKIEKLRNMANLDPFTDLEVAPNSNGDKVACNVTELKVNMSNVRSGAIILTWQQFRMDDPRSLLGYVVHSIEAPHRNITLYDGRDGCGGDGWRVDDVTTTDATVYHVLTQLRPYTQYAFYVRTYTIATERSGAQSPIYYFRTLPDEPSIPIKLTVHSPSSSTLSIKWEPPLQPNGNVTHYKIQAVCNDNQEYLQLRDYCKEPLASAENKKPVVIKPEETPSKTTNESCECEATNLPKIQNNINEKDRLSQISFEDELHNRVYIKRGDEQERKKREISNQNIGQSFVNDHHASHASMYTAAENKPVKKPQEPDKCKITIIANGNTTFLMTNLTHFTQYQLSVQACREREEEDKDNKENKGLCSTASIVTARTMKAEDVDDVKNVRVNAPKAPSNNKTTGMVHLMWDEPDSPNGIILTYQIEYRRVDIENIKPMSECVTRQEFLNKSKEYILKDLPAGNYSVRIVAISLAGYGEFSEKNFFYIEELRSGSTTDVLIGIFVTVFLLCCFGLVLFYLRRKFAPSVPNMKLIASVNPDYVSTAYVPDDWEVPRKKIELLRELGQGSFGMVYEGIARDVVKGKPEIRCAIKTVNEHATDRERIEFLNEASVMKAFDTTHVVRLLGVVSQGQPTLVVMELMANGDLKSYLRSHRPDAEQYNPTSSRQPPTLKRILQMAIEIADGMAYLAAKKFVHRDLAARNCMVAEDLTVKIGDFGMTRDIYETDYYRKGTKGLLPVRWMAPESLKDGVFTSNSDVWSYGVVLWEMATLASQPYQGLSNDQVLRYVIDGGIMERPENCPDKLYNLMRVCWQHKPSLRPSFLNLAAMLLEDACPTFKQVSFYHSTAGIEARAILNASQDDPSTPLRLTKEIEDFSLVSGSDQDSEPEDDLVDDAHDSDFDDKHVTINFPGYQVASFKGNQKSLDTSGPSLYSYKDNDPSQDTSGPSFGSYSERTANDPRFSNASVKRNSVESMHSGTGRDSLLKESEGSSTEPNTTANGYVFGRPTTNNTAKTTQC